VSYEILLKDLNRKVALAPGSTAGITISSDFLENVHAMFGRTDFIELRAQT
jgi:hypothetical protein